MTRALAVAACTAMLLAGCGGSKPSPTDTVPEVPPDRTVRGRVVAWMDSGFDAKILVPGHAAQPVAADGTFAIPDVDVPYDLVVAASGRAWVYAGATRRDPLVTLPAVGAFPRSTTFAVGAFPAAGAPAISTAARVALAFAGPILSYSARWSIQAPELFSIDASWSGPATIHPTVHALHRSTVAAGFPTEYFGYAAAPLELVDGTESMGARLDLAPIPDVGRLAGQFLVPDGYAFEGTIAYLEWPDGAQLSLGGSPSSTFDLPTPGVGASINVFAGALGPAGERVDCSRHTELTATGLEISFPSPPTQGAPADAATVVGTGLELTWSDPRAGVKWLVIADPITHDSVVTVFTTASSAALPDLSALGGALAPATAYEWTVMGTSFPSVDAALAPGRPADDCAAVSTVRTFTTAPAP